MRIAPTPGLQNDMTPVSAGPVWLTGINVRFRLEQCETIGLFGPMRDVGGNQIVLPASTYPYRRAFVTPSITEGAVLFGSASKVVLADYDPNSIPATGTRWRTLDLTPPGLVPAVDVVPVPAAANTTVPPVWWFADQDDLVIGSRANINGEPVYVWDRNRTNTFVPLAGSPTGAVGGAIVNRIAVLFGCTSFTEPDPRRYMTVRWSDRFDFENWTPSDITTSGELQLEGGSRIVGGGATDYGLVVWTDRRMALLTETFDLDSVFDRRYVGGGRGLLANSAWCEADGRVWWFDESRVLNVFDGGQPQQISNPLKHATIERLNDAQSGRAFLEPNPEFGEIILHYPTGTDDVPDRQLVYNYLMAAWSVWSLKRTGWSRRSGVIRTTAVDDQNRVWFHDLDVALPNAYVTGPGNPNDPNDALTEAYPTPRDTPAADDVEPFDFGVITNLVTLEDVTASAWRLTRVLIDHLPSPAVGAEDDTFDVVVTGYGEAQTVTAVAQDWQTHELGDNGKDFRVGGKAIQIGIYGKQIKSVIRFGGFDVTAAPGGER